MTNNVLKMKERKTIVVDESDLKSLIKLLKKEKTEFGGLL